MKRREFLTVLGGAAAFPLAARAQQTALPIVGFLSPATAETNAHLVGAILEGLQQAGFIEGRNVALEFRWAGDQNARLPELAAELVRLSAKVIVVSGYPTARAAKETTSTIPIVFNTGEDPVKLGLVDSLSRPGGNITGVTSLGGQLGAKRLELLHELMPAATAVGVLVNPTNPAVAEAQIKDWEAAARALGMHIHVLHATTERDLDAVFARLRDLKAQALVIGPDSLTISRSGQLATLAIQHRMPAIFQFRPFAAAGGLVSYGSSITDVFRLAGVYAGRILKGEKPADLPVQQSTKIEMIINLKTAKALGINVPLPLLGRADEVIE